MLFTWGFSNPDFFADKDNFKGKTGLTDEGNIEESTYGDSKAWKSSRHFISRILFWSYGKIRVFNATWSAGETEESSAIRNICSPCRSLVWSRNLDHHCCLAASQNRKQFYSTLHSWAALLSLAVCSSASYPFWKFWNTSSTKKIELSRD